MQISTILTLHRYDVCSLEKSILLIDIGQLNHAQDTIMLYQIQKLTLYTQHQIVVSYTSGEGNFINPGNQLVTLLSAPFNKTFACFTPFTPDKYETFRSVTKFEYAFKSDELMEIIIHYFQFGTQGKNRKCRKQTSYSIFDLSGQ